MNDCIVCMYRAIPWVPSLLCSTEVLRFIPLTHAQQLGLWIVFTRFDLLCSISNKGKVT